MGQRWMVLPVVATLLLAGTVSAQGDAVVVSRAGAPDGVSFEGRLCNDPGPVLNPFNPPVPETASHVDGPSSPPQGLGSLHVLPLAGNDAGLRVTSLPEPLGSLTAISVAGLSSLADQSIRVDLAVRGGSSGNTWAATQSVPASADAWTAADFSQAHFNWLPLQGGAAYNNLTTAEFADTVGPDENGQVDLVFLMVHMGGCNQTPESAVYYLDDLRVGFDGVTTTYDFEGPTAPTSTTLSLGRTTIIAGGQTTAGTQVSAPGVVELLARPATSPSYSVVATTSTDSDGRASVAVSPSVTTTYQWHYLGANGYAPSSSEPQTLGVRSKISLEVVDRSLHLGDQLQAHGTVTPRTKGTKVTLWRVFPDGHKDQIGTTKVGRKGRYAISANAKPRGKWKVFTRVASTSSNLSGTSPKVAITTS